jgi:hypothetical protein
VPHISHLSKKEKKERKIIKKLLSCFVSRDGSEEIFSSGKRDKKKIENFFGELRLVE